MNDMLAILWYYLEARYRRPFASRHDLEGWQARRFQRFACEVLVHSAFYREFVGKPLAQFPMADKTTMMDEFDRMNTRGLRRDELFALALRAEATRDFRPLAGDVAVGLSSGTSGRRGLFATSRSERQRYAGVALAKGLPRSLLHRQKIALLLRANNPLYETVKGSKRVTFAFFDLLSPFADLMKALAAFAPDVLIGPPQALRLVAEAVVRGEIPLAPQAIFAGAEVLEREDATAIEAAFGRRVDQIYQATEGFLGMSCRAGTLHLNEDAIIFERRYIDRESGRFMPVITDLWRSTQPIVRYRLDDVLIERREPCPCGSMLTPIERIEGRADDILFLPGITDQTLVPLMPDFVRDRLALAHDSIADYRVIQHGPTEIELLVEGRDREASCAAALEALSGAFDLVGVRRPRVTVGAAIPRDLGRKLRRVERRFPVPTLRER